MTIDLRSILDRLYTAASGYAEFHGPSCDEHDEYESDCGLCCGDVDLNMALDDARKALREAYREDMQNENPEA